MLFRSLLALAVAFPVFGAEQTFSHDVAPILYKHCVGCHHPNDIAPMSLLTYHDARPWAAAIKEAVLTGKMPPWKADPAYGRWSNDARLSEAEKSTLVAWANGQKLEGDPKDMPLQPRFFRTAGKSASPTQFFRFLSTR